MTRFVYALDEPHGDTLDEAKALVGGKAANLGVMARDLVLPVPPGFAITTATCRGFLADGWPDGLEDEIRSAMAEVEEKVGRRFGDPGRPLARQRPLGGAGVDAGDDGHDPRPRAERRDDARSRRGGRDAEFAEECRRRFVESFRSIVGVEDVPDDPWHQLRLAIEAVFRSWQSDRAKRLPRQGGHPRRPGHGRDGPGDGLRQPRARTPGPACCSRATRRPASPSSTATCCSTRRARTSSPAPTRPSRSPCSTRGCPAWRRELRAAAERLEHHYADLCDIEFTIEDGKLWLLQVRVGKRSPQAALRIAVDMAEDPDFPLTHEQAVRRGAAAARRPAAGHDRARDRRLAADRPASPPRRASPAGRSSPTPTLPSRSADAGTPAILVRAETSPDDVHGMARAAGILTSRGGLASHAAVVARGWGIPAVVGAEAVNVDGRGVTIGETDAARRSGRSRSMAGPARSSRAPSAARPRSYPRRPRCSGGRAAAGIEVDDGGERR